MIRKAAVAALLVGILFAAGGSAAGDDAAVRSSGFEGVWIGSWPMYQDTATTQDVTLTTGTRGDDGTFPVEYSWGAVSSMRGITPPGSLRTKGREREDTFVARWKTRQGVEHRLTLRKQGEDLVKARIDRTGSLSPVERPYSETQLKRR